MFLNLITLISDHDGLCFFVISWCKLLVWLWRYTHKYRIGLDFCPWTAMHFLLCCTITDDLLNVELLRDCLVSVHLSNLWGLPGFSDHWKSLPLCKSRYWSNQALLFCKLIIEYYTVAAWLIRGREIFKEISKLTWVTRPKGNFCWFWMEIFGIWLYGMCFV